MPDNNYYCSAGDSVKTEVAMALSERLPAPL